MQNGMPMPSKMQAIRNMAILMEAVWMITPIRRMAEPRVMLCLRPNLSLTYGTTGIAMTAPILKAALMRPRRAPFGLSKSEFYRISMIYACKSEDTDNRAMASRLANRS